MATFDDKITFQEEDSSFPYEINKMTSNTLVDETGKYQIYLYCFPVLYGFRVRCELRCFNKTYPDVFADICCGDKNEVIMLVYYALLKLFKSFHTNTPRELFYSLIPHHVVKPIWNDENMIQAIQNLLDLQGFDIAFSDVLNSISRSK